MSDGLSIFSSEMSSTSRNIFDPASSQHRNSGGGGFTVKKKKNSPVSKFRALVTHTPSLGCVGQDTWKLGFAQIGGTIFFVTFACLDISSKKRCL